MFDICCLDRGDDVVVEMPFERGILEIFGGIGSKKLTSQATLDGVTI